jgi:hypothetical protein
MTSVPETTIKERQSCKVPVDKFTTGHPSMFTEEGELKFKRVCIYV